MIFFNFSHTEDIPIYNYVSSVENPLTWGQFTDLNIQNGFEYPFSTAIWYISFHMHKTACMNRIYMIFLHFLPALMIDMIAKCFCQKPRLMKLYKKIHKFSSVISFFCTNEWVSVFRLTIRHCFFQTETVTTYGVCNVPLRSRHPHLNSYQLGDMT